MTIADGVELQFLWYVYPIVVAVDGIFNGPFGVQLGWFLVALPFLRIGNIQVLHFEIRSGCSNPLSCCCGQFGWDATTGSVETGRSLANLLDLGPTQH